MDSSPLSPSTPSRKAKRKKQGSESIPRWGYFVIGGFLIAIAAVVIVIRKPNKPIKESSANTPSETEIPKLSPSPPVPIPQVETLPPKEKTRAEFVLEDHPDDPNASILSKTQREIALLSLKEPLWVSDFRKLAELSRAEQPAALSPLFLYIFGKPDAERVYSVNAKVVSFLNVRRDYSVTEYTYSDRILNPTTEKREDLIIQFVDGLFSRASGPSGNECLR